MPIFWKKNIILGWQSNGVKRLIHVSTPSVYFGFYHRLNRSQNSLLPKTPANFYAKTKLLAEAEIDKAQQGERSRPALTRADRTKNS